MELFPYVITESTSTLCTFKRISYFKKEEKEKEKEKGECDWISFSHEITQRLSQHVFYSPLLGQQHSFAAWLPADFTIISLITVAAAQQFAIYVRHPLQHTETFARLSVRKCCRPPVLRDSWYLAERYHPFWVYRGEHWQLLTTYPRYSW